MNKLDEKSLVEYCVRSKSYNSEWYPMPEDSPFIAVELGEQLAYQLVDSGHLNTEEDIFVGIRHQNMEVAVHINHDS